MSTINGGEVPIREQLKIAAKAGYDSVELWLRDIDKYSDIEAQKEIWDRWLPYAIAFRAIGWSLH